MLVIAEDDVKAEHMLTRQELKRQELKRQELKRQEHHSSRHFAGEFAAELSELTVGATKAPGDIGRYREI